MITGRSYRLRNKTEPAPQDDPKPAKMHAGKNSRKQAEESSPPEVNSDSTAAAACQS